ncbi:hypothetical protein BDR06DRAFT_1062641 [Suillus hirtellus]|nr:hypothetical protein BDR06DRAFT_1062641 [Suillus hirtellus]
MGMRMWICRGAGIQMDRGLETWIGHLKVQTSLSNLDEVKAQSLFQAKCGIFDSSFLLEDTLDVARMAKVNGGNIDIPFANIALLYFIWQLLFHDRQYKQFIGEKQNLQPLFTYTSVLFKWALIEMSTEVFQDIDFKLNKATMEHTTMEDLFKTLTHEQIIVLTTSVHNYVLTAYHWSTFGWTDGVHLKFQIFPWINPCY